MKRDIKFRALTSGSGKWVYGDLVQLDDDTLIAGKDMPAGQFINGHIELQAISVYPESVGQYTGIKFNDVELYEGDIIEWYQRPEGYPQDPSKVRKTKVIELSNLIAGCFLYNFYDYKIIGNIHQNPELL